MKNFIESKIINARLVIKARSTRLVDSLMNFDLVDLFENLTLLLAKTEFHLLKCDIKIPEFNQQLLMEPQKFKSDSFVNGRLVFCESHAPGYSMYFTYLKSMNEFYFALNEINDYNSCVFLSFADCRNMLWKTFNSYLTIKAKHCLVFILQISMFK